MAFDQGEIMDMDFDPARWGTLPAGTYALDELATL